MLAPWKQWKEKWDTMLKLWATDLSLIRWRKKWRKVKDKCRIIKVSQNIFFSNCDFKKLLKKFFNVYRKVSLATLEKERKKIMDDLLGWSLYKYATATTFEKKHQVRFKLSCTNQVYLLNWKILNLFTPVFLRLMEYLQGSYWQSLRSWNFSWICTLLWFNIFLN